MARGRVGAAGGALGREAQGPQKSAPHPHRLWGCWRACVGSYWPRPHPSRAARFMPLPMQPSPVLPGPSFLILHVWVHITFPGLAMTPRWPRDHLGSPIACHIQSSAECLLPCVARLVLPGALVNQTAVGNIHQRLVTVYGPRI